MHTYVNYNVQREREREFDGSWIKTVVYVTSRQRAEGTKVPLGHLLLLLSVAP